MKLLFINVIDETREMENAFDNLGIGYMSAVLKQKFPDIRIGYKRLGNRDKLSELLKVKENRPDLVGLSSVSQNYNEAIDFAKICRQFNIPVIMGGVHISTLPKGLSKDMDVGVIGEAEETIVELMSNFKGGKFINLDKIDGICYWHENELKINKPRSPIKNLDVLPFPDRDLFKIDNSTVILITSRGCPFKCSFCSSAHFWGNVRFHSAEYVTKEVEFLIQKYKPNRIMFSDDLFVGHRQRLREISRLFNEKNIPKKVRFTVQCRANIVDDELCKLMKSMNVTDILMGLENSSQPILTYLKNNVTVEHNKNAVQKLKKYGFNVKGLFIIGTPLDTKERLEENLQFIKKYKMDDFEISILTPHPATPIWDYAKKEGLVNDHMDWDKLKMGFSKKSKLSDFDNELLLTKIDKKILFKYYKKMIGIKKRRMILMYLRLGLKNPSLVFPYILRRFRWARKYKT